jgi:hypothetical protein
VAGHVRTIRQLSAAGGCSGDLRDRQSTGERPTDLEHGAEPSARGGRSGTSNVTVNGAGGGSYVGGLSGRIPAATAYSAPSAGFDVCGLGNPSAGGQGLIGATLNLGERLDLACALQRAGRPDAAIALLCRQHGDVRQAMKDIGTPCPQDAPKQAATPVVAVVTPAAAPLDPNKNADWCDTLSSPAERREYAALCGLPNHRAVREPRHLAQ